MVLWNKEGRNPIQLLRFDGTFIWFIPQLLAERANHPGQTSCPDQGQDSPSQAEQSEQWLNMLYSLVLVTIIIYYVWLYDVFIYIYYTYKISYKGNKGVIQNNSEKRVFVSLPDIFWKINIPRKFVKSYLLWLLYINYVVKV